MSAGQEGGRCAPSQRSVPGDREILQDGGCPMESAVFSLFRVSVSATVLYGFAFIQACVSFKIRACVYIHMYYVHVVLSTCF